MKGYWKYIFDRFGINKYRFFVIKDGTDNNALFVFEDDYELHFFVSDLSGELNCNPFHLLKKAIANPDIVVPVMVYNDDF